MMAVMSKIAENEGVFRHESIEYVSLAIFGLSSSPKTKRFSRFGVPDDQFAKLGKLKIRFVWGIKGQR